MTTVIKQQDFIDSIYEALQFISYYHPRDFLKAMVRAYELEQNPSAKNAIAQILVNSRMCAIGHRPLCQDTGAVTCFVKIGMELFYAEGPDIVREIKKRGHKVFLDLKLHDIPNTVEKAMAVLSGLDVDIVNVHAAGTIDMMKAALKGLMRPDGTRPLIIAVTQLTSTDQERM